jgi:hypothetical protein
MDNLSDAARGRAVKARLMSVGTSERWSKEHATRASAMDVANAQIAGVFLMRAESR